MRYGFDKTTNHASSTSTSSFGAHTGFAPTSESSCCRNSENMICILKDTSFAVSFSLVMIIVAAVIICMRIILSGLSLSCLLALVAILLLLLAQIIKIIKNNKLETLPLAILSAET